MTFKLLNNLYVLQNDKLLKNNGSNNSTLKFLKKLKLTKKIKINLYNDSLYKKEFKYV